MKKPASPRPINLPYASTVASFYGDQGAVMGNSFLSRMARGGSGSSGSAAGGGTGGMVGGGAPRMIMQTQPANPRRR